MKGILGSVFLLWLANVTDFADTGIVFIAMILFTTGLSDIVERRKHGF